MHDEEMREPLFEFLEDRYGKVRILEEKTMGRSRADAVMVMPDLLCGVEIKSDADTYQRLAGQVRDYDLYYDRNIVVAGSTHGMHIEEHVPDYWGVITVERVGGQWDFYCLRRPDANPRRDWARKMEILWRPELSEIQKKLDMPKYRDKSRKFVVRKILERVPDKISEEELSRMVSEILFQRDYTTVRNTLSEYRKGEIARQLEQERDPSRQIELMMLQSETRYNLKKRKFKK